LTPLIGEFAIEQFGDPLALGHAPDAQTFGLKDLEARDVTNTIFGDGRPDRLGIEDEIASWHLVEIDHIKAPTERDVSGGAVIPLDAYWLQTGGGFADHCVSALGDRVGKGPVVCSTLAICWIFTNGQPFSLSSMFCCLGGLALSRC
jgi:hypothetical protein